MKKLKQSNVDNIKKRIAERNEAKIAEQPQEKTEPTTEESTDEYEKFGKKVESELSEINGSSESKLDGTKDQDSGKQEEQIIATNNEIDKLRKIAEEFKDKQIITPEIAQYISNLEAKTDVHFKTQIIELLESIDKRLEKFTEDLDLQ